MPGKADVGTYAERYGAAFQHHLLAVMGRAPGFIVRFRSALDPSYFESDLHRLAAKALLDHADQFRGIPSKATWGESVKSITDAESANRCAEMIEKLYEEDISDVPAVMAMAIDFGKEQAMVNAVLTAAAMLGKGDRDIMPLIQQAQLVGQDMLDVGIDYCNAEELRPIWYDPNKPAAEVLPTGIWHLDYAMGGGLRRGKLGVVLGVAKKGKTTTLINFGFGALIAAQGFNVVHYSCEMLQDEVAMRYDDRLAGPLLPMKQTDPMGYAAAMTDRAGKFVRGHLVIKSYPSRTLSVSMVRAHLSLLAADGFTPDLVIADYADIMRPERRLGEIRTEQAGIYEDLRTLAGELNCAVWTGSQAKQSAEAKETMSITDFAEAWEKAAIIDAGLAVCQTDQEAMDGKLRLVGIALRWVQGGWTVDCEVQRDRCRIRSLALYDEAMAQVMVGQSDPAAPPVVPPGESGEGGQSAVVASSAAEVIRAKYAPRRLKVGHTKK